MIKYIASVFIAAAILVAPGVSFSDDSVAANKWLRKAPADNVANVADLTGTTTKVSRGQTVHFVVYENDHTSGDTGQVVVDGALAACDITDAGGCASAPLFIQSPAAHVCVVSETGDGSASAAIVELHLCPTEDLCTDVRSLQTNLLQSSETTMCAEASFSGQAHNYDVTNIGGSWIYVDFTDLGSGTGDTTHVWVTGQD